MVLLAPLAGRALPSRQCAGPAPASPATPSPAKAQHQMREQSRALPSPALPSLPPSLPAPASCPPREATSAPPPTLAEEMNPPRMISICSAPSSAPATRSVMRCSPPQEGSVATSPRRSTRTYLPARRGKGQGRRGRVGTGRNPSMGGAASSLRTAQHSAGQPASQPPEGKAAAPSHSMPARPRALTLRAGQHDVALLAARQVVAPEREDGGAVGLGRGHQRAHGRDAGEHLGRAGGAGEQGGERA